MKSPKVANCLRRVSETNGEKSPTVSNPYREETVGDSANREGLTAGWMARIAAAQALKEVDLVSGRYRRLAFGCERPDPTSFCSDCRVEIGQLHVPSCCIELCPACGGQALVCDCAGDSQGQEVH